MREARALVTRGKWDDAVNVLEELDDHYPGRPAILGRLADASAPAWPAARWIG